MIRRGKATSFERKRQRYGYYFVFPFLLGFLLFELFPLIQSVYFSFCDLTASATSYDASWVGLQHYKNILFVDPEYRKTLVSSLGNMLVNVPVAVLFSFFLASVLNQKFIGRTVARTILFLPVILSSGMIMSLSSADFFNYSMAATGNLAGGAGATLSGSFTAVMENLNVNAQLISFISDLVSRIYDITIMSAVPMVIFLSGLQSISPSIYEASYIEGATKWEVFWKISFPMVSSLVLVNVVYCIVDSFTSEQNAAISSIHSAMFSSAQYGQGSAMAILYFVIISLILTVVYFIINRLVFYYD